MERKTNVVRLDKDLFNQLVKIKEKTGASITFMINQAVKKFLDDLNASNS